MSVPLKTTKIIMSTLEAKSVVPWNKGKLVGQKLPLKLKEIWSIRVRLQLATNRRELALFNLAIDSKLRSSDLVKMKVSNISNAGIVSARAMVLQQKTGRPVQFEITQATAPVRGLDRWAASPNKAIRPVTAGSAANSQIGWVVTFPCLTQSAQNSAFHSPKRAFVNGTNQSGISRMTDATCLLRVGAATSACGIAM
ncbi:MAG: hypothetical protein ACI9XK_004627 [Granulosicoccus sp.]|jgi:hypothetical protein